MPVLKQFMTVLRTTLIDQSRDRRAIGAAFLYSFFGPLLMLGMFTIMADARDRDRTTKVAVVGAEHAPNLVRELERRGMVVERRQGPLAGGHPNAIPASLGGADVLVSIPADFGTRWSQGIPAKLLIVRDDRNQSSTSAANKVEDEINQYGSFVAHARLVSRGVGAEMALPIQVRESNISQASGQTIYLAGSMLTFFLLAPFLTSMTTAIDVTAGERERQSLKPLLAQPVNPLALVIGKSAVPAIFGMAGTALTAALGFAVMRLAPLDKLGVDLSLDMSRLIVMILFLLPVALAAAALQSAVAMLAKSFKEAQTYIQFLTFAPIVLLFSTMLSGETGPVARLMPVTGHADVLRNLLSNGPVDGSQVALVTLLTLLLAAAGVWISKRQITDEKLLATL
jgi:sodium transport system permease protein